MPVYRRRRHLLLTVAAGLLFAQVATASEPSNAPNITEPRNAAAGFAITLWMVNVDALGDHCSKLASPMSGQFLGALRVVKSFGIAQSGFDFRKAPRELFDVRNQIHF